MNERAAPSALAGKIALVTGAATGLGKQIAAQLVAAGSKVAILGRTLASLEQVADELGAAAFPVVADVANPDQVRQAFAAVDSHFGDIDILINNAATYFPFRIEDASDQHLQTIINTNLLGPAYCVREAVPRMKRRGGGDIINVSSESTRNPFPFLTVYAASKGGLETLSQGLRTELKEYGIRVAVLRTGTLITTAGNNASLANWTPEQLADALALWEKTGHNSYSGAGMEPATVASTVLHALTLPREANMELFEVRSA